MGVNHPNLTDTSPCTGNGSWSNASSDTVCGFSTTSPPTHGSKKKSAENHTWAKCVVDDRRENCRRRISETRWRECVFRSTQPLHVSELHRLVAAARAHLPRHQGDWDAAHQWTCWARRVAALLSRARSGGFEIELCVLAARHNLPHDAKLADCAQLRELELRRPGSRHAGSGWVGSAQAALCFLESKVWVIEMGAKSREGREQDNSARR